MTDALPAAPSAEAAKSKMKDLKENGLALPGEDPTKCCWCIPIKIGMIICGVLILLYFLQFIQIILWWFDYGFVVYGILYVIAAAPMGLSCFWYVKWFMKIDDKERKANLMKAQLMVILSALISFAIQIVALIVGDQTFGGVVSYFITAIVYMIVFLYYAGVAKRYGN